MKIIFLLPSLRVSGSTIIFELINRLSDKGHDVRITSLDELTPFLYPLKITPQKFQDSLDFFKETDAIIAYHPACAFYINDLDVQAKKYYLLTDDIREFYPKAIFKAKFPDLDEDRINIEYETQQRYIESSYQLPFTFLVTNKSLKYLSYKKKGIVIPMGVNHQLFYPDMGIPKTGTLRILVEGNLLPWKGVMDINQALSTLRGFNLWTMSNTKFTIKSDKHWINPTIDDTRKILSSCDVVIRAYYEDGTADLQAQAMACGCAVITRKTSGSNMFCNDKNSLIFTDLDRKGSAKTIRKYIQLLMADKNLKNELIKNGLKTAKQLNWDNSVDILEKTLKGDKNG
jgi:glycosyltransferase involved in cell wall biosynthesis